MPLPGRMQDCFDRFSHRTSITETVGESIAAFCFDQYIWKAAREHGWKGFNITREVILKLDNFYALRNLVSVRGERNLH